MSRTTSRRRSAGGVDLRSRAFLALPGANLGDALRDRDLQPGFGPCRVVEVRHRDARQATAYGALDVPQIVLLFR